MSKSVRIDAERLANKLITGLRSVAITGSAQSFSPPGRAVLVTTAGTITGQLINDTADVAYALPAGLATLAFKSITSVTTLAGRIVF